MSTIVHVFCGVICLLWTPGFVLCNPSIGQAEETCVYSFQVPRQDSHAACSDSVSLDQQLLKTMVLSLQRQVTDLQQELLNSQGGVDVGQRNIRQCSWVNINEEKEDGIIRSCTTRKESDSTVLRVVWNGSLRLIKPATAAACRRWFFTIDGIECLTPATIDTQLYVGDPQDNDHRPAYLEGLCRGVSSGIINVTFNVGDCTNQGSSPKGDSYTGWDSTSRIIVEELDVQDPSLID